MCKSLHKQQRNHTQVGACRRDDAHTAVTVFRRTVGRWRSGAPGQSMTDTGGVTHGSAWTDLCHYFGFPVGGALWRRQDGRPDFNVSWQGTDTDTDQQQSTHPSHSCVR